MSDKYIGKYDNVFKELLEKRAEKREFEKLRTVSEYDKFINHMQEMIKTVYCPVVEVKNVILKDNAITYDIEIKTDPKVMERLRNKYKKGR